MNRRAKAIIVALVGVLALGSVVAFAGPAVYRDFFATPAAPEPVLLSADESELERPAAPGDLEAPQPVDFSGEWVVGEGSVAGYRVDEVLNGTPVTVTGRTSEVSGVLVVNGLTIESAQFEVDVDSIETDRGQRDSYFREQAIDTSSHPTASFVLTEPVTAEAEPVAGEVIEQQLTGELTIAGATLPATFTAQFRIGDPGVEVAGQIPITFIDFGVTAPNLGFVSVAPEGFVEFALVLTR